jgi:hypothetical protein
MFFEADILYIEEMHNEPIMAHPPATQSDLTFSQWLKLTLPTMKGLKLDFKSSNSIEHCLHILDENKEQVNTELTYFDSLLSFRPPFLRANLYCNINFA